MASDTTDRTDAVAAATPVVDERPAPSWLENRPLRRWPPRVDLGLLWAYREVALMLALRDLRIRYRQTLLGIGWAVLQPLLAAAIFAALFDRVAHLPSAGIPYPLFAFAGLVAWTYFSASVGTASESLASHQTLVTKVYFPRLLTPLASLAPALLDLLVSLVVLAALMAGYGRSPSWALVIAPAAVLWLVLVTFAAGTFVAALNVKYRDVRRVLAYALQIGLFASPVAYASVAVSEPYRPLYGLNPLVGVLELWRWTLLAGPAPGVEAIVSLAATLVSAFAAIAYFAAAEATFPDLI